MRAALLLASMVAAGALETAPSPVGGGIGLVVPRGWAALDEAAYHQRLPDNDFPAVAVTSPDGAVLFSLHRRDDIPFSGSAATMLSTIRERIPIKYPHAAIEETDNLEAADVRFAAASFVNPDSIENRRTTIVVFSWDGHLGMASWHRRADCFEADEQIVREHRVALLAAMRGHR